MNKPNKDQYYSVAEISKNGFLPWIRHPRSILGFINQDAKSRNVLKAIVKPSTAKGKMAVFGKRYLIKGSNIIKAVELFEKGTLFRKK